MGDDEKQGSEEEVMRSRITNVYIWDMDETLILFTSLLNRTYAAAFGKDVQKGLDVGHAWEKLILQLCDDFFFYDAIEDYNMPFLDALRQYDDGLDLSQYDFQRDGFTSPGDDSGKRKLAYRLRVIANKYEQGLRCLLGHKTMDHWNELYSVTDEYADRWLSSARAFLEQCSGRTEDPICSRVSAGEITNDNAAKPGHINILVTSGSLIPSLVKCLLFRFDDLISHGNVYSSFEVGKSQCFQWIKERFSSPNFRFCVIGDGLEECEAAQAMRWPFVQIDPRPAGLHRFPGLTMRTLGYYFAVVYDNPNAENVEDKS